MILKILNTKLAKPRKNKVTINNNSKDKYNIRFKLNDKDKVDNNEIVEEKND